MCLWPTGDCSDSDFRRSTACAILVSWSLYPPRGRHSHAAQPQNQKIKEPSHEIPAGAYFNFCPAQPCDCGHGRRGRKRRSCRGAQVPECNLSNHAGGIDPHHAHRRRVRGGHPRPRRLLRSRSAAAVPGRAFRFQGAQPHPRAASEGHGEANQRNRSRQSPENRLREKHRHRGHRP